jgi:hypothetical protein
MANKRPILRVVKGGKADGFAPQHTRTSLPSGPYRNDDADKLTEAEQREMRDREMRLAALQQLLD